MCGSARLHPCHAPALGGKCQSITAETPLSLLMLSNVYSKRLMIERTHPEGLIVAKYIRVRCHAAARSYRTGRPGRAVPVKSEVAPARQSRTHGHGWGASGDRAHWSGRRGSTPRPGERLGASRLSKLSLGQQRHRVILSGFAYRCTSPSPAVYGPARLAGGAET
jgi:hypothetical protein